MLRIAGLAAAVSTGTVLVRFAYVGDQRFRFCGLLLNLVLAAAPLSLSLLVRWVARRGWRLRGWAAWSVWLLFFPNAYYITTDLVHTRRFGSDGVVWWYDLLMTLSVATAGLFLGNLSLYLNQDLVRHRHGSRAGWLLVGGTLAVGAFGVWLGRSLRFNSWDAVFQPRALFEGLAGLAAGPRLEESAVFCCAFFAFTCAAYGFFVAAAELHRRIDGVPQRMGSPAEQPSPPR